MNDSEQRLANILDAFDESWEYTNFEKEHGIDLKTVYSSICDLWRIRDIWYDDDLWIGIQTLMCDLYQKDCNDVETLPLEYYEKTLEIVERLSTIDVVLDVGYGITRGKLVGIRWSIPVNPDYDIKKTALDPSTPLLLEHNGTIKKVQETKLYDGELVTVNEWNDGELPDWV